MRILSAVVVAAIAVLGTQPARAQASASAGVSVTILDPVGVGEGEALALTPLTAASRGAASGRLSGSFALDGSSERTVSVASSAGPLTHTNGADRLSLDVRAHRTGAGFDLSGGVTARGAAPPGLYAGAVSVVVNYN